MSWRRHLGEGSGCNYGRKTFEEAIGKPARIQSSPVSPQCLPQVLFLVNWLLLGIGVVVSTITLQHLRQAPVIPLLSSPMPANKPGPGFAGKIIQVDFQVWPLILVFVQLLITSILLQHLSPHRVIPLSSPQCRLMSPVQVLPRGSASLNLNPDRHKYKTRQVTNTRQQPRKYKTEQKYLEAVLCIRVSRSS